MSTKPMVGSPIEAMLASPPERDELVVHLFVRDGGQWGEIYREDGVYWLEIATGLEDPPLRLDAHELLEALGTSLGALKERLE